MNTLTKNMLSPRNSSLNSIKNSVLSTSSPLVKINTNTTGPSPISRQCEAIGGQILAEERLPKSNKSQIKTNKKLDRQPLPSKLNCLQTPVKVKLVHLNLKKVDETDLNH
jgi:hypothetical protein